jgi:hypothetical protein
MFIRDSRVGWLALSACLLAGPAFAQAPAYSDVPDRFRIEVGGFRIGADTELSFNTSGGLRPPVDFEGLNLPDSATRFYVEGFWRPWRRHQFSLSYYQHDREGDPLTAQNSFTWGDRVVSVGATVQAQTNSHYLSGVYRFAAYKNDRFEIGPSVGIGYLSIEAGISGEASVVGDADQASRPFDLSKSLGQVTGDVGGYFYWWAMPRLLVRGDLRYIIVHPENSEASVTDGRAAVVYHPWRSVGIGLQYTYSKFRYDRDILSTELGGSLRYSGGQLVVSAAFD